MPRGASPKREREYEKREDQVREERSLRRPKCRGACADRQQTARAVGETKEEKRKDREGRSPDRELPIADYQHLTVPQIKERLGGLSKRDRKKIRKYEEHHKARKTLLQILQRPA